MNKFHSTRRKRIRSLFTSGGPEIRKILKLNLLDRWLKLPCGFVSMAFEEKIKKERKRMKRKKKGVYCLVKVTA